MAAILDDVIREVFHEPGVVWKDHAGRPWKQSSRR